MADPLENERVTLAIVRNDLQHLMADFGAFRGEFASWRQEQDDRTSDLEDWAAISKERWDQHAHEHDREALMLKGWAAISSFIAAAVASVIGVFAKRS